MKSLLAASSDVLDFVLRSDGDVRRMPMKLINNLRRAILSETSELKIDNAFIRQFNEMYKRDMEKILNK